MPRLNIQLFTNQSTRPKLIKGRVLWIFAISLLFLLISSSAANLWFSRDTLSAFAPEDSLVIIHLTPTNQEWERLIRDFGNLPLISARPLTFKDLSATKTKEIAVFVFKNNGSAVAIRTEEKNLNKDLLSSLGINFQKLGKNQWLLSNQPLPYSTDGQTIIKTSVLWPRTIGTVKFGGFLGKISISKSGYSTETPKVKKTGVYLPNLPDSITTAISIQPKTEIKTDSILNHFDKLIAPFESIEVDEINKTLEKNGGFLILKEQDFLLQTEFEATGLSQIVKLAAIFTDPKIESMKMPDGSLAKEMVVDQNIAQFGSIWINGQEVKTVKTENKQFFVLDGQENDIFTSNQSLLEDFLNEKSKKVSKTCNKNKNLVFLKPRELENLFFDSIQITRQPSLVDFFFIFSEISLGSEKIYFCY